MKQINKKGWTALDFVVALLIFTGGISLFVIMIGSVANDYDNTDIIDPAFSEQFDKFDGATSTTGEMFDALNSEEGLGFFGATELFFNAGFTVINLIFQSVTTASALLFTFPTYFGIPTTASVIMMTLIFTILTAYIVFIIINSLRGNKL